MRLRQGLSSIRLRPRERWFYLIVAPWLLGFVLLQVVPLAATVALAFTAWTPPAAPVWVGLENVAELLADERFARAVVNTLAYALGTVLPGLALGLGIALVIGAVRRGGMLLRAAVFLPVVVAGVATTLMWAWILNPRFGLLNGLLDAVGVDGPAWLSDPAWAMPAMVLMGLWTAGVNVVVYGAALTTVPRDLLEAAALDGAGAVRRFRHVTWPALTPVTFYLAIVNGIAAFAVFTPTYLLTGGGPQDATLTTALYTYEAAFGAGRLGYAAATTVLVLVLVLALTGAQFAVGARRVRYLAAEA